MGTHGWFARLPMLLGVFLFVGEKLHPLRPWMHSLPQRLLVNAIIAALALPVSRFWVSPVAAVLARKALEKRRGLLWVLPLGPIRPWVGILLLDWSFYWWHVSLHRSRLLWRFHNVHHIDPDLDISTAPRFHFGELFLSVFFRALQVGIIGPSPRVLKIYDTLFQCATLFHHSNFKLPRHVESRLRRVFVTPDMHGIHHSLRRSETESNFSVVFSFWDRLHDSHTEGSQPGIGVPAYSLPEDNELTHAVRLPFLPQREYWPDLDSGLRN